MKNNGSIFWKLVAKYMGWFGKKSKPNKLQSVIDNDPVLRKLDDELQDMIDKLLSKIEKMQKEEPEDFKWLQDNGFIPKDFK